MKNQFIDPAGQRRPIQQRLVATTILIGDGLLDQVARLALDAIELDGYALGRNAVHGVQRSEEHTSERQSLMRISYAVFCFKKNTQHKVQQSKRHNYRPYI